MNKDEIFLAKTPAQLVGLIPDIINLKDPDEEILAAYSHQVYIVTSETKDETGLRLLKINFVDHCIIDTYESIVLLQLIIKAKKAIDIVNLIADIQRLEDPEINKAFCDKVKGMIATANKKDLDIFYLFFVDHCVGPIVCEQDEDLESAVYIRLQQLN